MPEINLTPTASFLDIGLARNGNGAKSGQAENFETASPLPARSWGNAKECIAGAVLVHGLGAHSGWFEALGRRLKVRQLYSVAYDQVGFGRRRTEQFTNPSQWYDDLVTAFRFVKSQIGEKPIFIMGNSLGAAVSLQVVADKRVLPSGLVMFSPGFDGHPDAFNLLYRTKAILSALTNPEKEVPVPYSIDTITRTENVKNWLHADPDMRFSPTGGMLLGVLKLSMTVSRVRTVACPVFMIQAGHDKVVDGKAAKKLFDKLQCPSKKELFYEEAWHDLMFDPVIDQLSDSLVSWISELKPRR